MEEVRETLNIEQQNHRAEMLRGRYELELMSERYRQVRDLLGSAELARKEYEDRIHGLVQRRLNSSLVTAQRSTRERSRQAELEEEIRVLHAELATSPPTVSREVESEQPGPDRASAGPIRKMNSSRPGPKSSC